MKKLTMSLNVAGLVCAALLSAQAMAQSAPVPDHPRENEVNQRLENQQSGIDRGLANGSLSAGQAARDEGHDANIARREAVDESKHDGHITKREQNRLNRSENRNARRIHRQKHA